MTALDPQLWNARPGLPKLLAALDAEGGETRIVGGAVRDWLLGLDVADIDLATRLAPEAVMMRLAKAGIKAVPTGLAHGTVTAVVDGAAHEITTLRRDVETDGRHARVAFTDDWEADASRRDFTINALYADPRSGSIFDCFGGAADLQARRVRFIGAPLRRIAEDHLRILRFFRFSARYADKPDPKGLAACAARANDLMALSRERIRDEMLKILRLAKPVDVVEAMVGHGILAPVLPEISIDAIAGLQALVAAEEGAGVGPAPIRRLAALLPADAGVAADIAARLKLSNADRARLVHGAGRGPVPGDPRALAYAIGAEATLDRMLIGLDERAQHWAMPLDRWVRPRLPVSGKDLIAMGLPPGPEVSRKLHAVESAWVAAGFPGDRTKVIAIARTIMGVT